jgi:hypothetical protein
MMRLFPFYITPGRLTPRGLCVIIGGLILNALWFAASIAPAVLLLKWAFA